MRFSQSRVVLGVALLLALAPTSAWAHWCDDLWSSGYDIVVRPDSDTSPKALYVENHWGYQLTNFKLTATSTSGGSITLTAPTTKVANTLLPGEKGIWKITAGSPAKIEDITFDVTFGDTSGTNSRQYGCYPVMGASPVMVVKNDGNLFPSTIAGIPKDGSDPKPDSAHGCTFGDVSLGRSLQEQALADWDDLGVGLDNILTLYCAGRGSWGVNDRTLKPNSYCKDGNSTSCPTTKPTSIPGSRSDYMRLWGAGALAIRKASLGTRLPVFRERLKCGANDGDPGIAGYTLFVLGYLGDDSGAKSFLQTQASASGDVGTIAKAALYLMGDTSQKSAVQAGVQSSSVFVKVACAGALGIVDKDDTSVTSAIIPEVKWIEPDTMGGGSDNGKGMYSAHILEIVAFDRRGWVHRGMPTGAVSFYGETAGTSGTGGTSGGAGTSGSGGTSGGGGASGTARTSGTGGTPGPGGTSGRAGTGGIAGTAGSGGTTPGSTATVGSGGSGGGRSGSGGTTTASGGSLGSGGSPSSGGAANSGGQAAGGTEAPGSGGAAGSGSGGSASSSGGSSGSGGSSTSSGGSGGSKVASDDAGTGCKCSLGGRPTVPPISLLALAGLALLLVRRRRP
jgi:MYXO-CTERM domain-containing protein